MFIILSLNPIDTTCIFDGHGLAVIPHPACFNLWRASQKVKQMDDELLAGWVILPLPQNKLLCNHVLFYIVTLLYIHL
jgi:hypothetical protein